MEHKCIEPSRNRSYLPFAKMGSIDPKMTELWPFSFGKFEIFTIGQGDSQIFKNFLVANKNGHSQVIFGSIGTIFLVIGSNIYVFQCNLLSNLKRQ